MKLLSLLCLLFSPVVLLAQHQPVRDLVRPATRKTGNPDAQKKPAAMAGSVATTVPNRPTAAPQPVYDLPEVTVTGYSTGCIKYGFVDVPRPLYPTLPYIDRMRQRWKTEAERH